MRYALIETATGQHFGPFCAPNEVEALKNRPDLTNPAVIELAPEIPDDLSGLWGRESDGEWALVPRDQVTDPGALDAIAALEAEQAKRQTLLDLSVTDLSMVRAIEDLVSALIDKGVIAETDLPQAVRDKIQARADLRAALNA